MVAHGEEKRVRFVVAATQAKQEGAKDTVRDQLRDGVRYVSSSYLSENKVRSFSMNQVFARTYLDAAVSPRKEGKFDGTWARSSAGGRTGRCTKWVAARSMICFCNCENDTELHIYISKMHQETMSGKRKVNGVKWQIALRVNIC